MTDDRRYTIAEIDALREAYRNLYLWGNYKGPNVSQYSIGPDGYGSGGGGGCSRNFNENDLTKIVEEQVRTSMMAGHTVADLIGS